MIYQKLKDVFGYSEFREGQLKVITHLMDGASTAAIFPTGSGKSLCYQLSALLMPHLTVVVSPLLALMQDQVDFMVTHQIPAVKIDSTLSPEEDRKTMEAIRQGRIKILLISVERFKNERFRNFLSQIPVSLLVVDEAHCISEWGHNFRPDYLKLPQYRRAFNFDKVLLLTATATPKVIVDMCQKFQIPQDNVVVTGFYRPNLHLEVLGLEESQKRSYLWKLLEPDPLAPTIVYVTLQKTAEMVANFLMEQGIHAKAYHAGLKSEKREAIQKEFMESATPCIVATIAFGMGIDKRNIRRVIHYDLPKSIENYSQEIGRAGRDGELSHCTLLANKDSVHVLENFVYGDTPEKEGLLAVLQKIKEAGTSWEVQMYTLSNETNIRQLPLKTLLVYLEIYGIIKPQYSYYANYRFFNHVPDEQLINKFQGERRQFIEQVFLGSPKARKWRTVNFDTIYNNYRTPRHRVTAALDYFHQKGFITLEATNMTELYKIEVPDFNIEELSEKLYSLFKKKEIIETKRIDKMVQLFESSECLSFQLASYFGQQLPWQECNHCSVCETGPATIPLSAQLKPLDHYDFTTLTQDFLQLFKTAPSSELITRYLCGITVPMISKKKAKKLPYFGYMERYRFSDILNWVNERRG